MRTHAETCERRLMIISYCTSNNDRLEVEDTTSNERMDDLSANHEKQIH